MKHYFVQNGTSIYMVYVKTNIDEKDYSPLGEPLYKETNLKKEEIATDTALGPVFPLEPFIEKLSDYEGKKFIKVAMEFELINKGIEEEFKSKIPQFRDYIKTALSSKTVDEIITAEGKFRLKEEIMTKLNQNMKTKAVKNIFFTEFEVENK